MEHVLAYYEFSDFFIDKSGTFKNEICYSVLNEQHFLIFEQKEHQFDLFVSKYTSEKEIGKNAPEILELLVTKYNKSNPEHRIILRKYLQ